MSALLFLCYLRVPTQYPFRLQIYCNGHALLGHKLQKNNISHTLIDNAFLFIDGIAKANKLTHDLKIERIHRVVDRYAELFCLVSKKLRVTPHRSIMQVEYVTAIIFKRQKDFQSMYYLLIETLIHSIKPENIATFPGHKLHVNHRVEMGNTFNARHVGTRIKHTMDPVAI